MNTQQSLAESYDDQGLDALTQGRLHDAETAFATALIHDPLRAEAHANLGIVQLERGRLPEAVGCFRRALAVRPALPKAFSGIGTALKASGWLDDAEARFRRALAIDPGHAEAHHNLGLVLAEQGRPREAVDAFGHALREVPDLAEAHFGQALALLKLGVWAEGWRKFEFRWVRSAGYGSPPRRYPKPLWSGDPAAGRTILLWPEQGFGDTLQFARFARDLVAQGWRVILEVQPELARLLSALPGMRVIASGEALPPFDVHFPLLSLPDRLGMTPETVSAIPCIRVEREAVQSWRARLAGGLAVGVAWRGNPGHIRDHLRSTGVSCFAGFLDQPGIIAVSLQMDAHPEELASLAQSAPILAPAAGFRDFADTAALVSALDLVIAVDTAVLHLAGALAVPVWGLLDFAGDWRWLTDRGDSPWYSSLRLFRQEKLGDWASVTAAVRAELGDLAERRAAS